MYLSQLNAFQSFLVGVALQWLTHGINARLSCSRVAPPSHSLQRRWPRRGAVIVVFVSASGIFVPVKSLHRVSKVVLSVSEYPYRRRRDNDYGCTDQR